MVKRAPRPKLTSTEQHAKFVETARALEVDESPEAFDRAFGKVVKPKDTASPSKEI